MKADVFEQVSMEDFVAALNRLEGELAVTLSPEAPKEPDLFDEKRFLNRMFGDRALALEVAGLFLNASGNLLGALVEALEQEGPGGSGQGSPVPKRLR